MLDNITNYLVPILTFVVTIIVAIINIKKLPNRKLSNISIEYKLLKEIKKDFNSNNKDIALIGFQKILNFRLSQKEFEFILLNDKFSLHYIHFRKIRSYLRFNEKELYYKMKMRKINLYLSKFLFGLNFLSIIAMFIYSFKHQSSQHDISYIVNSIIIIVIYMSYFFFTYNYYNNTYWANRIASESQNKLTKK